MHLLAYAHHRFCGGRSSTASLLARSAAAATVLRSKTAGPTGTIMAGRGAKDPPVNSTEI